MPHGSYNGRAFGRGIVEEGVQVVKEIISKVDGISNGNLNSLTLKIGLAVAIVNVSMSSHERVECSQLIKEDKDVISRRASEAWNVCTCEEYPRGSKTQDLIDRCAKFLHSCLIVSCPFESILL